MLGGTSSRFGGGEFHDNGALKAQDIATMDCGENVDTSRLELPGDQLALLAQLKATGKPVVTVLIQGRPYAMEAVTAHSDAIFCCFYPGLTGGEALAQILFGATAPAGRLPVSLPDHVGQLPVYYNYKDSYRGMDYYDSRERPRYAFGSGLTYTTFSYRLLEAPADTEARRVDTLTVRAAVTNTGTRAASAVPQLYLHRTQGVVTSRIRALCDFQKLNLAPGETQTVTLSIPREALAQWDSQMQQQVFPGKIQWFLGDCGETYLSGTFTLV